MCGENGKTLRYTRKEAVHRRGGSREQRRDQPRQTDDVSSLFEMELVRSKGGRNGGNVLDDHGQGEGVAGNNEETDQTDRRHVKPVQDGTCAE
jgi:hypothetical protein